MTTTSTGLRCPVTRRMCDGVAAFALTTPCSEPPTPGKNGLIICDRHEVERRAERCGIPPEQWLVNIGQEDRAATLGLDVALTGRHTLARDTAEYITANLLHPTTDADRALDQLIVTRDTTTLADREMPTTPDSIKAELLDGYLWVSWMDERVTSAMRQLHPGSASDAVRKYQIGDLVKVARLDDDDIRGVLGLPGIVRAYGLGEYQVDLSRRGHVERERFAEHELELATPSAVAGTSES